MIVGVLINARSGRGAVPEMPPSILYALSHSEEEALAALRFFAAHGVDTLCVYGGDGTLDSTIRMMRKYDIFPQEPYVAVLKGGTTNMTWQDVGLDTVSTLLKGGEIRFVERRVIKVEMEGLEPQYGFFFGLGAIPEAIDQTRAQMHSRGLTGKTGEALMLLKTVMKLVFGRVEGDAVLNPRDVAYRFSAQGPESVERNVFIFCTTLQRLVQGLNPIDDRHRMGVVGLNYPYKKFSKIWRDFFGADKKAFSANGAFRQYVETVEFNFDGRWTLDGELFTARKGSAVLLKIDAPVRFVVEA